MRNRKVETRLFRHEQGRASARRCREMPNTGEALAVLLLKRVEVALTAADIQPLPRRVVEQIVSVADDVERPGLLSCRRVVHENLGGPATSDEQAMVRLVQRHREVRFRTGDWP